MPIDLFKPSVPELPTYLKYLAMIDQNCMYSNFGPMHQLFKEGLAQHFDVSPAELELFSSGTMALVAALEGLKKKDRPYCILPSWTFVASAQSVIAAGLTPIFVDVDLDSMQLSSNIIKALPSEILMQASVVLVVSPYGAPLELGGFESIAIQFGF